MNPNLSKLFEIAQKPERLILGLMSGTSLDGLDLALCQIKGSGTQSQVQVKAYKTVAYPENFKEELRSIFAKKQVDLEKLTLLNAYIGNYHAELILQTLRDWKIEPHEVDLIASHGQTVYHAPKHFHGQQNYPNATLQIGDGDHIAVKTGILTISDFRQKSVAGGGEGAPLALYGDYFLLSSRDENRILLNLGGIANFTFLPKDGDTSRIISTDVGPANTLIDAAVRAYFDLDFDRDGQIAQSGKVHSNLLAELMKHPFIAEKLPKSTGPEMFNLAWVQALIQEKSWDIKPADIVATLSQFTVNVLVKCIRENFNFPATHIYTSGGGLHNGFIMNELQLQLPEYKFSDLAVLGINADAKEAVLFALLANETLLGQGHQLGNAPALTMGKLSFPG